MVLHVRTILLLSTFVCIPPPHVKVHFVHSGSPSCYKKISQQKAQVKLLIGSGKQRRLHPILTPFHENSASRSATVIATPNIVSFSIQHPALYFGQIPYPA